MHFYYKLYLCLICAADEHAHSHASISQYEALNTVGGMKGQGGNNSKHAN